MSKKEVLIDERRWKKCPFGVEERFCEYQETRAKDLLSAMRGELVFFCKLSRLGDCPRFSEMFKEVL